MAKRDIQQEITNKIISHIEAGALPWHKSWKDGASNLALPRRANGEYYKGINVLLLWIASMENEYTADQWMTFKQAKTAGGNVRKGEKGTQIVFYSTFDREDKDTGEEVKIPFLKSYTVFNVEQIENLPCDLTPDLFEDDAEEAQIDPIELAEDFFVATGAQIINSGKNPCYIPSLDQIHMPKISAFESAEEYYATLAHELVHWTGHKTRTDRLMSNAKKKEYAFEELIAELGACFLLPQISITPDVENSAAYVASWLKALRDDKKFIFQAAAQAQKAVDFVNEIPAHTYAIAAE